MIPQDFYAQQSHLSDPGTYSYLFNDLPDDIPGLCTVVQGIYRHYITAKAMPLERRLEVDTRYLSDILARMVFLDDRPLTEKRPSERRFIGCCRDAALLLTAMLRHKGIPARSRAGFAKYIRIEGTKGFRVDHVITEYWDATQLRWRLVDAEQSPYLIEHNHLDFDVTDVPRDQFVVGGLAWQQIRNGNVPPSRFGAHPKDFFKGEWAVRNRMLQDLASLNKMELLLWDTWGWLDYGLKFTYSDNQKLDHIAELTQAGDQGFEELRAIYNTSMQLKAPPVVICYSPVQPRHTVKLHEELFL